MARLVSVFERHELATVIDDNNLNVGDIVMLEPENQMGEQKYEVVQSHNGGKVLKLIWDAEIGNIPNRNNMSNNNMSYSYDDEKYMEDDYKENVRGGSRRRNRKTKKVKKSKKAKKVKKSKKAKKSKKSKKAKKTKKAKK